MHEEQLLRDVPAQPAVQGQREGTAAERIGPLFTQVESNMVQENRTEGY